MSYVRPASVRFSLSFYVLSLMRRCRVHMLPLTTDLEEVSKAFSEGS